jgi:LPS export ABC transporter protein LptC
MEGLSMTQSVRGRKSWKVEARTARLREDSNHASLTAPVVEIYRLGKPALRARSRLGSADMDTQDVVMTGGVVLDLLEENSVLRTDRLRFDSAKRRFLSDRPVVLERPGAVIRGQGCEADADLKEVRVFKQESAFRGGSK